MLEKREFDKNDFMWRLSAAVTLASGFFTLIVFILIVINYLQIRAADPVDNTMLTDMRLEYADLPEQDAVLQKRIQDLDLMTRKAFFTSQELLRKGAILLMVGSIIFLTAFKYMVRWKPDLPDLAEVPTAEKEFLSYAKSRTLITWACVAMLAGGLFSAFMTESALLSGPDEVLKAAQNFGQPEPDAEGVEGTGEEVPDAPAFEAPGWDAVQANWPSFRGPGAIGIATATEAPINWDVESGEGIKWKVEVPLQGTNSPVVWGDRLFMSGASEEKFEVYCYDTETGDLVWSQTVPKFPKTPDELPSVTEETGYAASTMAVHGDRVFAIFANADIVSYDFDGNQIWGYNLGLPDNHYGYSSSLLAYENLLFVQLDSTSNGKVVALDAGTGEQVWSEERKEISWASPALADTPSGLQLILTSTNDVDAYDPLSGNLIWTQDCLYGEVAPSAGYSNGVVLVANDFATATAIQLDGSGETVTSEILWEWDEYLPEVSSPVGDGERFYYGTSMGDIVSLDVATGEAAWVEEVDTGFYASPVLVGDKIYMPDMDGNMYIVRAGAEYELLAKPSLGEMTVATPAFVNGRIYIRTEEHLYCIE